MTNHIFLFFKTFATKFTSEGKVNFGMKFQFFVTLKTLTTNWTNQWNFFFFDTEVMFSVVSKLKNWQDFLTNITIGESWFMQPRNLKIQDVQITVIGCVAHIQLSFFHSSLLWFWGRLLKRLLFGTHMHMWVICVLKTKMMLILGYYFYCPLPKMNVEFSTVLEWNMILFGQ